MLALEPALQSLTGLRELFTGCNELSQPMAVAAGRLGVAAANQEAGEQGEGGAGEAEQEGEEAREEEEVRTMQGPT